MDNQNRKLELLGNAPIPKALLAMGIPTMIWYAHQRLVQSC